MRRSAIALVILIAGLLAVGCTQPQGGGGSSAAPAPAASSAPVAPGY
jgi:hypothetical protein